MCSIAPVVFSILYTRWTREGAYFRSAAFSCRTRSVFHRAGSFLRSAAGWTREHTKCIPSRREFSPFCTRAGRERTHLPFYGFLIFRSEKGSVLRRASFANKPAQNTGSFPYKPPKHRTFLKINFYAKEFLSYKNQRCHPVKKAPRSFRHSKPSNSTNWRSFPLSQAPGHGQTAFAAHPDFGKNPKPKSAPPFFGTPTRGRSAQRCCAEPSRFARRRIGVRAPEPGKAASPIFASRHLQSR